MLTVATGNKAVAAAVKEAAPAVVAAYPITPQTEIVEQIAEYVSSGELKSQYIPVESEHSAMAACIGASVTGARTFTATSSHGLHYMHEMVNWAAGARLPIVMANVNRALGPGWNIWAEHTDAFQERDSGWLQVYVGSVQEAFDAVLMAFCIAEDERVLLPVMVNLDGFLVQATQGLRQLWRTLRQFTVESTPMKLRVPALPFARRNPSKLARSLSGTNAVGRTSAPNA